MVLSTLLQRDRNNIDLFRLIAACMVIYAHAYALLPGAEGKDLLTRWVSQDDSGSLAVKLFFFLSGLVVTNSLLTKQEVLPFIIARLFRLWPALLWVLLVTTVVLGPIFSVQEPGAYFSAPATWRYVTANLELNTAYELPGVFMDSLGNASVNGSLWTLRYEVAAYLVLIATFMVGVFKFRPLALVVGLLIIADPLFENRLLLTWLPKDHWVAFLAPSFAFGSLMALYKDRIQLTLPLALGLLLLAVMMSKSAQASYYLYAAVFIGVLYLSGLPTVLRLRPKADLSYGVYLWGYPVQQTLVRLFPHQDVAAHQITAILLSLFLGYCSWHLVEQRSIRGGVWISQRVRQWTRAT